MYYFMFIIMNLKTVIQDYSRIDRLVIADCPVPYELKKLQFKIYKYVSPYQE